MKAYSYADCCINSTAEAIGAMRDTETDITYSTMLRNCEGLIDWAVNAGYDRRASQGLTLKGDSYVSYYKSTYKGSPCFFLVWSHIEYIWIKRGSQ